MSNKKSMDVVTRPAAKAVEATIVNQNTFTNSVIGVLMLFVLMLFVLISIAFSSYMVYFGSDSMVAKLMLIPQVGFAAWVAIKKFAFTK